MTFKESVFCTLSFDGVHNWATIPATQELKNVQFLKLPHRHTFNVTAFKYVDHSDRDIEFIVLKRIIQKYLRQKYYSDETDTHDIGSQSCEMIAKELCIEFNLYKCIVDEDGENGGIVEVIND